MMTAYQEAINFLEKYIPSPDKKYPGELGLKRMKYLVGLLGNPQKSYPTIHVTGTSGKGSTATFIASILSTKYKVGLLTSPHLVKVNERIKIITKEFSNSIDISDKDFIELVRKIKPFIKKIEKSKYGTPSYFEIITAMAFMHFFDEKVEIAVVEVGMGGRYDATNVINSEVAVITNVGLDHTEVLGNTIEKIAEDKAGIIKQNIRVVSGIKQKSVIRVIRSKIKTQKSKLSLLNNDYSYKITSISEEGSVFDYYGEKIYRNLHIKMLGEHQVENASIAIRAIEELNMNMSLRGSRLNRETKQSQTRLPRSPPAGGSLAMTEKDIRTGLQNAFIPGRMEIIKKNPLVILDGAHNPDKIKALVSAIKTIYPRKKVTVILAIKNDKNAQKMISQIVKIAHKVIFTQYNLVTDTGITKSYDSTDLFKIAKELKIGREIEIINNPSDALDQAIKKAKKDDLILVTGSLYLIGEIIRLRSGSPRGLRPRSRNFTSADSRSCNPDKIGNSF
ncbi:bifunctional folylpolyglutamate synthase/dihydrofolate synthase [Candidatus Microgenomates bacterium]|nr:bifunctional folylpolyglutamate synthase/dihydrofolate synthase [Candidatus Microgenomates bacterium]